MPIGPAVRQLLGPLEKPVAKFYRSMFIDLDHLTHQIKQWCPASNILEFGCGEGVVVEKLLLEYPKATVTGIDITPKIGRMFNGDEKRVTFKQQPIKEFAAEHIECFDLLVINDVMHHIPWELHQEILEDARKTLKPDGYLVLKEWDRNYTPIYFICYFFDRYISGDAQVGYKTTNELRELIGLIFGEDSIKSESQIRPWSNNVIFLVKK
jgi:2-polyprenyl-3-methyl-5-hydroxy-6-metoxy-1,4-benzoquinol methylase